MFYVDQLRDQTDRNNVAILNLEELLGIPCVPEEGLVPFHGLDVDKRLSSSFQDKNDMPESCATFTF